MNKKLLFAAGATAVCLVAFSFKPLDSQKGVYDPVSGNIIFNAGTAKSFTSSYDNHSDKQVVWSKYHKDWTAVQEIETVQKVSNVLNKY